jgi:signal transduction histidine kinase
MINFDNSFTLFLVILCMALGIFVLIHGIKKKSNQYFFYFSLFLSIWVFSSLCARNLRYDQVYPYVNIGFAVSAFAGYFFLKFCFYFPRQIFVNVLWKNVIIFIVPFFFAIVSLMGLVAMPRREGLDGFVISQEFFYTPFSVFLFTYIFGGLTFLFYKYKYLKGIYKKQITYVIIGLSLTSIFALFTSLVLPWLINITDIYKLGIYSIIFMIIFTTYAILAHRLFDIKVIIRKTAVYSILLAFVLAIYSLVIFIFAQAFGTGETQITARTVVPNLIAAMLIAIGFEPLRRWITDKTDKYLFKGEYKPQDVLNKLSKILSSVLDLDEALSSIISILITEMRIERASAFVLTADLQTKKTVVKRAKCSGFGEEKITLNADNHLISYFEKYISVNKKVMCQANDKNKCETVVESRPIVAEDMENEIKIGSKVGELEKNTVSELKNMKCELAFPIIVKGNLIGIFVLGAKKSGDIYSDEDLELLKTIANQTAAAIQKARFYEEDQLKSEFVSIASHELLTPTSAIEGYLSMILDEGMGKVDDQARKYLENVYVSSKRLAGLVKDLLNVSRIEGGRIVIQSKNFDIRSMIKQVASEMTPKAKEKQLELVCEGLDRNMPMVWADPERTHQVLINLIGNAIKYTDKGKITVRADFSLSVIRVSVIDNGIGIRSDEIPHLFEKFYRASNSDNNGAQGTGLGLYITRQMVELMGGMIQVNSELGKGSIFSFSLPREKKSEKK